MICLVVFQASKHKRTDRSVKCCLRKVEVGKPWVRLSKDKMKVRVTPFWSIVLKQSVWSFSLLITQGGEDEDRKTGEREMGSICGSVASQGVHKAVVLNMPNTLFSYIYCIHVILVAL